jgi:hypothetical protein
MFTDTAAPALLAAVSPPTMFTDTAAPALLAVGSLTTMFTDTAAPALLAAVSPPTMFTDTAAPALLAAGSPPTMFTDTAAPALLAAVSPPTMFTHTTTLFQQPIVEISHRMPKLRSYVDNDNVCRHTHFEHFVENGYHHFIRAVTEGVGCRYDTMLIAKFGHSFMVTIYGCVNHEFCFLGGTRTANHLRLDAQISAFREMNLTFQR